MSRRHSTAAKERRARFPPFGFVCLKKVPIKSTYRRQAATIPDADRLDEHRCRLPGCASDAADHRPDDCRPSMPSAIVDPGRISPPWLRRVVDRPSVARTIAARPRRFPMLTADRCRLPGRATMPPGSRRLPTLPRIDADRDRRSRTNLAALVAMDGRSSVSCPDDCRQDRDDCRC